MRRPAAIGLRFLFLGLACVAVVGAALVDGSLLVATHRARRALEREGAPGPDDAERLVRAGDWDAVAARLGLRTQAEATASTHAAAATAATAARDFDAAARHAGFARRLEAGDGAGAGPVDAEAALDRALLARLCAPARVLGLLAAAGLLAAGLASRARRRRARRRACWVAALDPRLAARTTGATSRSGRLLLDPAEGGLTVDVFLRPPPGAGRPPRPGPTLAVVLSHAGSSRSVRLTPRRDVREDAVRIRVRDETLAAIAARPGTWWLRARLDDRALGEVRLDVLPRPVGAPPRPRIPVRA